MFFFCCFLLPFLSLAWLERLYKNWQLFLSFPSSPSACDLPGALRASDHTTPAVGGSLRLSVLFCSLSLTRSMSCYKACRGSPLTCHHVLIDCTPSECIAADRMRICLKLQLSCFRTLEQRTAGASGFARHRADSNRFMRLLQKDTLPPLQHGHIGLGGTEQEYEGQLATSSQSNSSLKLDDV